MKKILLTLFAVAAVFVACDKDGLYQEISNINVLEQADEINASVEISEKEAIDLLSSLIGNISDLPEGDLFYNAPKKAKGSASTARTSDGSCGDERGAGDFITLTYFQNANELAVLVRSEDNIPVTIPDSEVSLELTYILSGSTYTIRNEGTGFNVASGLTPSAGLLAAFGNPLNLLYRVNSANAPQAVLTGALRVAAGIDCVGQSIGWTEDGSVIGLFTHPTYGSYQLSDAPFPLSGVLARVMSDDAPTGGATLNYAAAGSMTDNAAVRAAIEGDFDGTRD